MNGKELTSAVFAAVAMVGANRPSSKVTRFACRKYRFGWTKTSLLDPTNET
jgi:hypothetical protein